MGCYVKIIKSDFTIKKEDFDRAYEIVCNLNRRDDLKTGGAYGGTPTPKPADSKSCSCNPDRWFAWMPWNYDETCNSLPEVLEEIGFGFGIDYNDDGDIVGLTYDGKTGDEDVFLDALRPIIKEGSYIVWEGEEGEEWATRF